MREGGREQDRERINPGQPFKYFNFSRVTNNATLSVNHSPQERWKSEEGPVCLSERRFLESPAISFAYRVEYLLTYVFAAI